MSSANELMNSQEITNAFHNQLLGIQLGNITRLSDSYFRNATLTVEGPTSFGMRGIYDNSSTAIIFLLGLRLDNMRIEIANLTASATENTGVLNSSVTIIGIRDGGIVTLGSSIQVNYFKFQNDWLISSEVWDFGSFNCSNGSFNCG
jgi:hypothetical protein